MIKCLVCDSEDWKNVDEHRGKPGGMCMCQKCGFITYPKRIKEGLKEFYRKDYRKPPNINNVFTGQRKLAYHAAFLEDTFKNWGKDKELVVFEQGAAFGMVLDWIKRIFPKGRFFGSELTLSFRRVAKHKFGFNLSEDFDPSRKYDLIMSYKVAEHVPEIDKELRKMVECLSPDGLFYISVPCWFEYMTNFGVGGFSLDYYYADPHINVWTKKLFESVLQKVGLEIVKYDGVMYDDTYLCKRNDELMKKPREYEDPKKIEEKMKKIKEAYGFYKDRKYKEATNIFPNFPHAWDGRYEMDRNVLHLKGWQGIKDGFLKEAFKACPQATEVYIKAGDIAMRYGKWEEAEKYFAESLRMKPENPISWANLAQCHNQMSYVADDQHEKMHHIYEAINVREHLAGVSLQNQFDMTNWILNDMARIPMDYKPPQKKGEQNASTQNRSN